MRITIGQEKDEEFPCKAHACSASLCKCVPIGDQNYDMLSLVLGSFVSEEKILRKSIENATNPRTQGRKNSININFLVRISRGHS